MKIDPAAQVIPSRYNPQVETTKSDYSNLKTFGDKNESLAKSTNTIQDAGTPVTVNLNLSRQTVDTLERLGSLNNFLSNVATSLQKTEEGLNTANTAIEKMKSELGKIVKNFPPFNLESQERMQLLMSYSAIQKEMAKMSVPPPPQPLYDRVKHIWQDLFTSENGQNISTPSLPQDAPDTHVNAAVQRLDGTQSQIAAVQAELGNSMLSSQGAGG